MVYNEHVALGDLSNAESFFRTVKAERECLVTYLRYFEIVDRRLPCEQAAECFTKDTNIEYHMKGAPMKFRGRSEYAVFMRKAVAAQEMSAHFVGQTRFVWTSGAPRLFSYVTSWQWFIANADDGDLRPADFATIGYSEDDFECVEGQWLISNRVVKPVAGLTVVGGLISKT